MQCPIHDKGYTERDLTKLTNDQDIANKIKMIQDVFFEISHILWIIVIRIIAHLDTGILNDIFQKTYPQYPWYGVYQIRIRQNIRTHKNHILVF